MIFLNKRAEKGLPRSANRLDLFSQIDLIKFFQIDRSLIRTLFVKCKPELLMSLLEIILVNVFRSTERFFIKGLFRY